MHIVAYWIVLITHAGYVYKQAHTSTKLWVSKHYVPQVLRLKTGISTNMFNIFHQNDS